MTGCLTPCFYKEYMFLNNNPKILNDGMVGFVPGDQIVIGLWAVSRNTEFREEVPDQNHYFRSLILAGPALPVHLLAG